MPTTSFALLDDTGTAAAARQQVTSTSTSATTVTTTITSASTPTTTVPTSTVAPTTVVLLSTGGPPTTAPTTTIVKAPTTTTTTSLPAAGQNGPGHFSGRILRDGQALSNVTVKVVNIHTPGWPRMDVLDTLGGHDGVDVFVTTTDVNGNWSVTGLSASKQFMLKVFPPSLCDAYGEIAAGYTTAESGYINSHGDPFMSTRLAPGPDTYNVWSMGRYLFDMPVHVYPGVGGALNGNRGYGDLDIAFFTRPGSINTSRGGQSGCTPS